MWLHYEDKSAFGISQVSHGEVDMTKYTVEKIENGVATLRYPNNSWSEVLLSSDMTQEDLDNMAYEFGPKIGSVPSFVHVGSVGTAKAKTQPEENQSSSDHSITSNPAWLQNRIDAYGDVAGQIEYITENGLEAWQKHVAEIKAKYPSE